MPLENGGSYFFWYQISDLISTHQRWKLSDTWGKTKWWKELIFISYDAEMKSSNILGFPNFIMLDDFVILKKFLIGQKIMTNISRICADFFCSQSQKCAIWVSIQPMFGPELRKYLTDTPGTYQNSLILLWLQNHRLGTLEYVKCMIKIT